MHPDRPSTTAALVAFLRAAADVGVTTVPDFRDPVAARLLPQPFATLQRLIARAVRGRPWVRSALRLSTLGMGDMLPLRTLAIDDAVRAAAPFDQLVILGAGLDGRAWRLDELSPTTVFEVDHPATQRYKRERVASLAPAAREVRFVAVDFLRDRLGDSLAAAGHDTARPTFWIWEGVVMYLSTEEVRATLREVGARSAPGSRIAATYLATRSGRAAVSVLVRAFGEPIRNMLSPADVARLFDEIGFRVLSDVDTLEQASRSGAHPLANPLMRAERIVVAARP
jgi:methyltransferase (TIGR00027 family)